MYSDVVYGRAHSIMSTYNPTFVPPVLPITHLCVNVRWYAHKWATSPKSHEFRDSLFDSTDRRNETLATHEDKSVEHRLVVNSLMSRIPEDMAQLLQWSYANGFTPKEIAEHLKMPVKTVRERIEIAMMLARDYAGVADA